MPLTWNPLTSTYGSYDFFKYMNPYVNPVQLATQQYSAPSGFNISNYQQTAADFQRSQNALSSQNALNKGLGVAGDVIGLGADLFGTASEKLNIGTPMPQYFQEGVDPSYQAGDYFNRAYSARPQGATGGEIVGASLKGAKIGAQFGGGVGAAIGAGVGALGSIGAGEIRRARQRREKDKALKLAGAEQQKFNTAQEEYDKQQMAQAEYTRRANPYRRMSNLYNI